MKKNIFILFCLLFTLYANAVTVEISDGISNPILKEKIEHNASVLLTEINRAQASFQDLDTQGLLAVLPDNAKTSLNGLWEVSPFKCTKDYVYERLLRTSTGYQIRNIPLLMTPNATFNEDYHQEAVILFDKEGNIVGFHTALSQNQYKEIIENANPKRIDDLVRRQIILDFVEQYRTAWMAKDSLYLDAIFSDDALIITGTVVTKQITKDGIVLPQEIKYNVKTKQEYMKSLRKTFRMYKSIRVIFDGIEIVAHPNPKFRDYYGVTLRQGYTANGIRQYSDNGYVFLLWKFPEQGSDDFPQIYVRTWQPDKIGNKPLADEDKIGLKSFERGLW